MRSPAALAIFLTACGGGGSSLPYETLAEYDLTRAVPYDVIASLFSDHAAKDRAILVPEGAKIGWEPEARWRYPVGTILIKTFYYPADLRQPDGPRRLLETRLIINDAEDGWTPHTYVWNEAQTEARRTIAGARIPSTWLDENGQPQSLDYRVPNTNECLGCHGPKGQTELLGPRTRQLDRDHDYGAGPVNQIDHLASLGLFDVTPPATRAHLVDPFGTAPVTERARSYLEANCAHCHNPTAAAQSTGLRLNIETTEPVDLGVCRSPFSAGEGTGGRLFDVVPGHPEQSIMVFRMESTEPEIKMPEMPTQLSDADGVALISAWIAEMTPEGCL